MVEFCGAHRGKIVILRNDVDMPAVQRIFSVGVCDHRRPRVDAVQPIDGAVGVEVPRTVNGHSAIGEKSDVLHNDLLHKSIFLRFVTKQKIYKRLYLLYNYYTTHKTECQY